MKKSPIYGFALSLASTLAVLVPHGSFAYSNFEKQHYAGYGSEFYKIPLPVTPSVSKEYRERCEKLLSESDPAQQKTQSDYLICCDRAHILQTLGRYSEAEAVCQEGLKLKQTAYGYYRLAELAFVQQDFQTTIEMCTKAIEISPDFKDIFLLRMAAYILDGKKRAANRDKMSVLVLLKASVSKELDDWQNETVPNSDGMVMHTYGKRRVSSPTEFFRIDPNEEPKPLDTAGFE